MRIIGMSGVAYKMREKIGKALKSRAEAIRKALSEYNRRAAELKPPRPQLSWNDLMEMVSLSEFDVLRDARQDIRDLPWARREHRQAMNTYFNVKRAREEIARLNVEIPRLFSSMVDEHVDFHHAIEATADISPSLSHELRARQQYAEAMNGHVVAWLYKTSQLPGFTGRLAYGYREGRDETLLEGVLLPRWASNTVSEGMTTVQETGIMTVEEDSGETGGIPGLDSIRDSGRFVDALDRMEEPE